MATTTPNFGWTVPTSSDLVKNGATAIETLGDAIDASMVDLKGGTTGQVLSKASNTDMDFTWSTPSAGATAINPNATVNGGFDIWQRGTSFTATGRTFTADRWYKYRGGDAAGATYSRQNSATSAPGTQYCMRMQRDSGNTSTGSMQLYSDFETNSSIIYAGQTVTVSFYARKGADYSGGNFNLVLQSGTGTDQNQFGGFTNQTVVLTVSASSASMNTSTFVRYTGTVTLATNITQLGFQAIYVPTGTAGAADFVEITGIKLEEGSTATDFVRSGGTIQGELAVCQRYYFRNTPGTNYGIVTTGGVCFSTTTVLFGAQLPVQMRVYPTSVDFGNLQVFDSGNSTYSISAVGLSALNSGPNFAGFEITATGLTAGRPCLLRQNNNAAGFIGFSAEL